MYLDVPDIDLGDKRGQLVVKTRKLITAIENLSLAETRLIQLAIIGAREKGTLSNEERLTVSLESYAKTFDTTLKNARGIMQDADKSLKKKTFYFLEDGDKGTANWVQESIYKSEKQALEILFTTRVINEITNIDGYQAFFTSYRLSQTSDFESIYSLRLFELLMSWANVGKTPVYELMAFREQLGVLPHEYSRMGNFKARVLDPAVKEINEKSGVEVEYTQSTKGRTILGFAFTIKEKNVFKRKKITIQEALEISQEIEGAYTNESESDAILRVMKHKDEEGRSVYLIVGKDNKKLTNEDWEEFRASKNKSMEKRDKDAESYKWITIGNTRVDDQFIDDHIKAGETREDCRNRVIAVLKRQIEDAVNDDSIPEHVRFYNNHNHNHNHNDNDDN